MPNPFGINQTGEPRPLALRLSDGSVHDETTGCWTWSGTRTADGYARISVNGVSRPAHRVAYVLAYGPILHGLTVDHLCRNRACVNAAHLEAVSRGENTLRGEGPTAVNARRTSCTKGHPFDEANTYVKPDGGRDCRTCIRARVARYKAKKNGVSGGR